MKSEELWKQYADYTEITSCTARTLAFGAAGVCWIFKSEQNVLPLTLLLALAATVLFFIFDLAQYAVSAVIYRSWVRREEKRRWQESESIEGEYKKPWWLDRTAYILWWIKLGCLLAAFALIAVHIVSVACVAA